MIIEKFSYSQHGGGPREWRIEPVNFQLVNLLVGKNASGKSRTLNVINGLAQLLSGEPKVTFKTGDYHVHFKDEATRYEYQLRYREGRIELERFLKNDEELLNRGSGGVGQIFAAKTGSFLDFQTPDEELAAVNRRDSLQHPFFEALHQWAKGVRHFQFGTPLGKDHFAIIVKDFQVPLNPKDTGAVIGIFRQGEKEFGADFIFGIKQDMMAVGYHIEEVGVTPPQSIVVQSSPPTEIVGLYVKERNLNDVTEQFDMSQGMFRALSIIIHLNYSQRSESPSCILIDDIGEGLDFERSCALIDLIVGKSKRANVQLLMSTNDRFVMNKVPLEYWVLIQREGGICRFFNYANSREKFEDFKFTGMNNFDFFATDFIHSNFHEEAGNIR